MSRTYKDNPRKKGSRKERKLSVRAVRRNPPDLRKLTHALIQLALEQAADEADAKRHAEGQAKGPVEKADD